MIGKIKWFSPEKGFGFIRSLDGPDHFVYRSDTSDGKTSHKARKLSLKLASIVDGHVLGTCAPLKWGCAMATNNGQGGQKKRKPLRTLLLPNSSPVPNWFFDSVLSDPDFPDTVCRVFLFLLRKTVGWSNWTEKLSLPDIQNGASVSHDSAVYAVKVICDCYGWFIKHPGRGRRPTRFQVDLTRLAKEWFETRQNYLFWMYQTTVPTPEQLRDMPCTAEVIAEGGRRYEEKFGQKPQAEPQMQSAVWQVALNNGQRH